MIDVLKVVEASMTVLAPYAPYAKKAAEGFVSGAGKAAFETAVGFLKGLSRLFHGDSRAEEVAANYEKDPEIYAGALQAILARKAQDPQFAEALQSLLQSAAPSVFVDQVAKDADTLTGIEDAEVSKGSVSVKQDASKVKDTIGIGKLKI